MQNRPMNVRQAEGAALKLVRESLVIDAELMQQGSVEIMDADRIFGDIITIVVGGSVSEAGLEAATGAPHGKAALVMIASVILRREIALAIDRAAKLAAPDDEGVVEQAAA